MSDNKTPEQQIAELKSEVGDLTAALKTAAEGSIVKSHSDSSASYWGETEEVATIDANNAGHRSNYVAEGWQGCGKSEFKSFGDFLKSGYAAKGQGEWRKQALTPYQPVMKAVQGMSEQVGADGGFMVYPEFSKSILERVYENDIFDQTDNYTVGGNSLTFTRNAETSRANGSRHGGVRGYWVAEGGSLTKSNPTLAQVSLRLKKCAVLVYLTDEILQDTGSSLEDYVSRCAAAEFNFMLGDAVFNGSGAGQPLGITNGGSLVSVAKESGQAADTIVSANIDKMWSRRAMGSNKYQWFHHQDCGAEIDDLGFDVGNGGVPLYRTNNSIAEQSPQTLKGAKRTETEFNATLGDANDIILADLSQYLTISKGGITQEASIHVEFLTDQTALRFVMRVDGRPWEDTAVTQYKGSNTQSAYINLAARA